MTFPTGWSYKRSIAIDTGQKSGSPTGIVLTITESSGIADANGPLDADGTAPAQNGGGDLRVSSDAAGTNQIPLDVVSFVTNNDHASATCELKINFDDLSSDTLYLWWGTAGTESQPAVTDTYGRNAVYSSGGHLLVYGMHEDPSGSAPQMTDRTGNGYNGTSVGSMTSGDVVAGKIGSAIDFEGTDDYINTNATPFGGVTAFSVVSWLNLDSLSNSPMVLGTVDSGSQPADDGIQIFIRTTGQIDSIIRKDGYSAESSTNDGSTLSTSTWYQIAVTWDGSNIRRYLNGSATGTVDATTIPSIGSNASFPMYVGAVNNVGTAANLMNGRMDDLRCYSSARSAGDIATLYNCESANGTFWSVGSVQSIGGGSISPHVMYYRRLMTG